MKEAIIALDQGSQSSRALAFDPRGRLLAQAQVPIKTFYPRPGWVEHDAEDIRLSQERALDRVMAQLPTTVRVLGLGIACQRSTVVAWDAKSGRPLARAISWQDGRAAQLLATLPAKGQQVHEMTGLYLNPYYSAPKLRWLLDHEEKVRHAAESGTLRVGPVASYLLWRWTDGELFAVDPSLAQRMLLMNVRSLQWDPELLSLFGVSETALPKILPSAGFWGALRRRGARLPVLAVLGDQQSAALGLGADEQGEGVLNHGTGAFFLLNTGNEDRRVPGLLTSVAWQRPDSPGHYFLEGTVHAAGTSFAWLKDNLGLLSDVKAVEAACRRSRQRLLALIAIGGLGAPRWDYSTFTTFLGLNSKTVPDDLVRAVVEGIGFMIGDIVATMRGAGLAVRSIRAAGGLSRIDSLLQFESDLLQTPIRRMPESEATAAGVARLAAEQSGVRWTVSRRTGGTVGVERVFQPRIASEESDRLGAGWRVFVEAQQRVSTELRRLGVLV